MYRVAIDIGGTKTRLALMDAGAAVLAERRLPSAEAMQGGAAAGLAAVIRALCDQGQVALAQVEGIGIGVPGVVERLDDVVALCSNLPELEGVPLGPQLQALLGVPVFVDNDVNLITLGEHMQGRGRGIDDLACVAVGSGIGLGLIVRGALYTGADGAAGELGHMVVVPDGRPCNCGQRGCLEMYCSGKALALQADYVRTGAPSVVDAGRSVPWTEAATVIVAAREGQERALAVMDEAFRYLGLGIAALVNILNPRLVILGGGIIDAWPQGVTTVRDEVCRLAATLIRDRLQVESWRLGEAAGLVGAFRLVGDMLRQTEEGRG